MSNSKHPLARLEFTSRVAKRAQYEAFEFTVTPAGVRVRNCSHANPEDHEYLVTVTDGLPIRCTCPADERFEGACKHRLAVAIRRPVLTAVDQPVVADGGTGSAVPDKPDATDADSEECSECLDDFPCWECVRNGDRDLPTG
jgi:hypothetical protein